MMAKQPPSPILIAVLLLGVLGLGIWAWLYLFKKEPAPPTAISAPAPAEPAIGEPSTPAPPPPPLPPLDASDALVRTLVAQLSAHPELAEWLVSGDLARRFVAVVDNIARDESPRVHLRPLEPERGFSTSYRDGELIIAPGNFERYDAVIEVFAAVDKKEAVAIYRQLKPLFDKAYRELGYPEGDFDRTLKRALNRLIAVPIPNGPIQLDERVTNYRFADPALENLGPVEKHLLRLGPLNARTLQERLKAFLDAWHTAPEATSASGSPPEAAAQE